MSSDISDPADGIRATALEWHVRIEAGDLSLEEEATFEAWRSQDLRHADAYDRAATLWSALGTLDQEKLGRDLFREAPKLSVLHRLFGQRPARMHWISGLAAASFVLAASVLGLLLLGPETGDPASDGITLAAADSHITQIGETREVQLSDGSTLTLGPGTEIETMLSPQDRRVRLVQGAVVFEVASDRDRPFIVSADAFEARVLGTVFDMRKSAETIRMSVIEGRVQAAHPLVLQGEASSLISKYQLGAGQQIVATKADGLSTVTEFSIDQFASWRQGRLSYVGATLNEMIEDANRYASMPIVLDIDETQLVDNKVTFAFDAEEMAAMLAVLPNLFPVSVEETDTAVFIRRRD